MKIIIFDTNAWLDLYMIHPLALKEIVSKFEEEKDLFWIPEQVYWEFNNNAKKKRDCALNIIKNISENATKGINNIKNQIHQDLSNLKRDVILSDERLLDYIDKNFKEIHKHIKYELELINKQYTEKMEIITEGQDVINKLVNDIYTNNTPFHLTEIQRMNLYEEGELRIKYGIPPGLTDVDKKNDSKNLMYRHRYGDLLIWKDLLRKTEELIQAMRDEEKLNVIFVENEKKGDWWKNNEKRVIAPALREEFCYIADGKAEIEMINFTDFLMKYCEDFGIKATTVTSLVKKNMYTEKVISKINDTAKEILEKALFEYYKSTTEQEKLFNNKSYLGGSFDSVKDFKIKVKEIENVTLEEDYKLRLFAKINFDYFGSLTECIGGKHTETETVKDTYTVVINVELSIDYSKGYDDVYFDVGNINVQGFQTIRRSNMKVLKDIVFERDGYSCQLCGKSLQQGAQLCIDHIVPWSLGGTNDLDNLQTLCVQCNNIKGTSIT